MLFLKASFIAVHVFEMDEKLLFCVSVREGDKMLHGAEWRETGQGRTLIDLFVEVCGNKVLGQQVQVLVSKERSFLEAAVVPVCTPLSTLAEKTQSYIQYILKNNDKKVGNKDVFRTLLSMKNEVLCENS